MFVAVWQIDDVDAGYRIPVAALHHPLCLGGLHPPFVDVMLEFKILSSHKRNY